MVRLTPAVVAPVGNHGGSPCGLWCSRPPPCFPLSRSRSQVAAWFRLHYRGLAGSPRRRGPAPPADSKRLPQACFGRRCDPPQPRLRRVPKFKPPPPQRSSRPPRRSVCTLLQRRAPASAMVGPEPPSRRLSRLAAAEPRLATTACLQPRGLVEPPPRATPPRPRPRRASLALSAAAPRRAASPRLALSAPHAAAPAHLCSAPRARVRADATRLAPPNHLQAGLASPSLYPRRLAPSLRPCGSVALASPVHTALSRLVGDALSRRQLQLHLTPPQAAVSAGGSRCHPRGRAEPPVPKRRGAHHQRLSRRQ